MTEEYRRLPDEDKLVSWVLNGETTPHEEKIISMMKERQKRMKRELMEGREYNIKVSSPIDTVLGLTAIFGVVLCVVAAGVWCAWHLIQLYLSG